MGDEVEGDVACGRDEGGGFEGSHRSSGGQSDAECRLDTHYSVQEGRLQVGTPEPVETEPVEAAGLGRLGDREGALQEDFA